MFLVKSPKMAVLQAMNGADATERKELLYMALTNKGLKEILSEAGISDENASTAVTKIMSGHNTSLDYWKEQAETAIKERDAAIKERDTCKADAEKLTAVQKELDAIKGEDWEKKYNDLLAANAAKEARAAKETALRAYFTGKGITGKGQEIAMLSASGQLDALELKKDGAIKDTSTLDALVSGTLAPLVSQTTTLPADNPPSGGTSVPSGGSTMTREQIEKITDTSERQKAMIANPGLFGLSAPT